MAIAAKSMAGLRTAALLIAATLSACTTTDQPTTRPTGPRQSARSSVTPPCASERGATIPVLPSWGEIPPWVAATVLTGGRALVALSAGYPAANRAELHAFTAGCASDPGFGDKGVERLAFPRGTVQFTAAISSRDGGALLAGGTSHGWLIARIDRTGALDRAFGNGGWAVLPWAGSASALVETPSGRILVGGSDGGGCCVRAWLTELTRSGQIVRTFGRQGRSVVPIGVGPDSGVSRVSAAADGTIYVLNAGGNMGCWGVSVSKFTATGTLSRSFERHFTAAMRKLAPSGVFVADLVPRSRGFLLGGTSQPDCVTDSPNPRERGLIASFRADGELEPSFGAGGRASFPVEMAQSATALPQNDGTTLLVLTQPVITHDNERATVTLLKLAATGELVHSYGKGGVLRIALPFRNSDWPASALLVTAASDGHISVVISSDAQGKGLEVRYPGT